jgi:RNA polymerase sigma-70 factor (ECF subfamily)
VTDIRKYQRLIGQEVLRVVKNQVGAEDIEDIIADVMVDLLETKLAKYDPDRGELTTFIGNVARRHAIDAMRRRRDVLTESGEVGSFEQHDPDVLSELIRLEQAQRVRRALAKLPEDERDLMEAMMQDGWNAKAYANARGVSPNALHVKRCRILKKLRKMLASKG